MSLCVCCDVSGSALPCVRLCSCVDVTSFHSSQLLPPTEQEKKRNRRRQKKGSCGNRRRSAREPSQARRDVDINKSGNDCCRLGFLQLVQGSLSSRAVVTVRIWKISNHLAPGSRRPSPPGRRARQPSGTGDFLGSLRDSNRTFSWSKPAGGAQCRGWDLSSSTGPTALVVRWSMRGRSSLRCIVSFRCTRGVS